jgi:hypothetical protein
MLTSDGGAQKIYSAAAGRRSAPHAGAVSPHHLLPLGYEHYDAHLRRLSPSLDVALVWADEQAEVAPGSRCLRRSALSRAVSFTDLFTNANAEEVVSEVLGFPCRAAGRC